MKKVIKNCVNKSLTLFSKKKDGSAKKEDDLTKNEQELTKDDKVTSIPRDNLDIIVENLKKIQLNYDENAKNVIVTPKKIVTNETDDKNREDDDNDGSIDEDADEFDNFTYKKVKDDRNDSMSSKDSGFNDLIDKSNHSSDNDDEDALAKDFEGLVFDDEKKGDKKKLQKVYLPRGPIRNASAINNIGHPYQKQTFYINSNTFTGSQLIIRTQQNTELTDVTNKRPDDICELAKKEIEKRPFGEEDIINIIKEYDIDLVPNRQVNDRVVETNNLADFKETRDYVPDFVPTVQGTSPKVDSNSHNVLMSPENEIFFQDFDSEYRLSSMLNPPKDATIYHSIDTEFYYSDLNSLLTPPNSNQSARGTCATPSPPHPGSSNDLFMTDNFSPSSSNTLNRDYENYQEIQANDVETQAMAIQNFKGLKNNLENDQEAYSKVDGVETQKAMTMKHFKDIQKKLMANFAQSICCKKVDSRKIMKEFFLKMDPDESKSLSMKVSSMDLKTVKLMLMHTFVDISNKKTNQESLYALYGLLCERILNERPMEYVTDDGLKILAVSVFRCPKQPILTAVLVECINIALGTDLGRQMDKPVFTEVDSSGNTLLAVCAQAGDKYVGGLAEIAKSNVPLFDVDHFNNEGFTALHLAVRAHGSSVRCLQTVHVLVAHAQADIHIGERKGGETPLHLAVNSAECDLDMVLTLFGHVDTTMWKDFACKQNRSSQSPIQYARTAGNSGSRKNYPKAVVNFLKKCRQTPTKNKAS